MYCLTLCKRIIDLCPGPVLIKTPRSIPSTLLLEVAPKSNFTFKVKVTPRSRNAAKVAAFLNVATLSLIKSNKMSLFW